MREVMLNVELTEERLKAATDRYLTEGIGPEGFPGPERVYLSLRPFVHVRGMYELCPEGYAAVAVTLGDGVDLLAEGYHCRERVYEAWMADQICSELLLLSCEALEETIREETGLWPGRRLFFGDGEEYSLERMREMVRALRFPGITVTEGGMLRPLKSTVYLLFMRKERGAVERPCEYCRSKACGWLRGAELREESPG